MVVYHVLSHMTHDVMFPLYGVLARQVKRRHYVYNFHYGHSLITKIKTIIVAIKAVKLVKCLNKINVHLYLLKQALLINRQSATFCFALILRNFLIVCSGRLGNLVEKPAQPLYSCN